MSFPPPTHRQARLMWTALSGLAFAVIVALVVGLVWGLGRVLQILSPVLWPLAVAGVLAYLLDPVVDFLERKGTSRSRAIVSVFVIALVIVIGLATAVVPQVVSEARELWARRDSYKTRIEQRLDNWIKHPPELLNKLLGRESPKLGTSAEESSSATNVVPESMTGTNAATLPSADQPLKVAPTLDTQTLQSAAAWVTAALPKIGSWLFGQVSRVAGWFGVVAGLVLIPVYLFYLLLEKRGIKSNWAAYLPVSDSRFKTELVFVLKSINDHLIAFFRGQVLVAICDGILYTIGFLIIGLPYAVLIGVMAIFLTIIPFLGAIITCIVALILAFVQYGDWLHPLLVLAVFAVVQSLEGLVISPKIMGDRVGLHPLTIIIAVMAGTTLLGGLLGGILAIPLTAALKVILSRYVWKRREAQRAV